MEQLERIAHLAGISNDAVNKVGLLHERGLLQEADKLTPVEDILQADSITDVAADNVDTLSKHENVPKESPVPKEVLDALVASIKELGDRVEVTIQSDTAQGTVELTALNVLKTLLAHLKKDTDTEVKLATVYFTSTMSVYQEFVPPTVFDFLVSTNSHASLRDYINVIQTR